MSEGITGMEGSIYFLIAKITTYVDAGCIDRTICVLIFFLLFIYALFMLFFIYAVHTFIIR